MMQAFECVVEMLGMILQTQEGACISGCCVVGIGACIFWRLAR